MINKNIYIFNKKKNPAKVFPCSFYKLCVPPKRKPKLARLKPTYLPKCLKNVYIPSVYLLQLGAISVNMLAALLPAQSYLL